MERPRGSLRGLRWIPFFLVLATACSTQGGQVEVSPTPQEPEQRTLSVTSPTPKEEEPTPTAEPEPVYVTFETEGESRSSAVIGPEGGSLEAISEEGTTYLLELPEGALLSPSEISMTPIRQMEGLPPGAEMAASVLLEPEGLVLFEPATLTIDSPNIEGTEPLYAFTTFSGGEDPHLMPSSHSESSLRLTLTHFSSPGVIEVSNELVWNIEEAFASSNQESQAVTDFLKAQENLSGQDLLDAFINALESWSHAVETRLKNAAAADRFIDRALADYLSWKSWVRIMDEAEGSVADGAVRQALEDRIAELDELAATALAEAMERAHDRCVQNRDVNQAIRITRWALIAQRLELFGLDGLDRQHSKDLVKTCMRFRVVFTSTNENGMNLGFYDTQVHADFHINLTEFELGSAVVSGTGSLQYNYATLTAQGNTCRLSTKSGELRVDLSMDYNLIDGPAVVTDKVTIRYTFPTPPKEAMPCNAAANAATEYWGAMHIRNYRDKLEGRTIKLEVAANPTGGDFVDEELKAGSTTELFGKDLTLIGLIHDPQP